MFLHSRKVRSIVILLIGVVFVLGLFAYVGGGETLKDVWMTWIQDEEVRPEPDPQPDSEPNPKPLEPEVKPEPQEPLEPEPETQPNSEQEPLAQPEQEPEPEKKPNSTPIIYTNQQLIIPGLEGSTTVTASKVINEGALNSSSKQIALTFDAGWLFDQTIDLLNTLDKYNVKSTFFLRGNWVKDHQELAREILKRGHAVENHSLTHGHMKAMSDSEIKNEILQTTRIIKEVTGYNPYLFRPPFGEYDNKILKILGEQGYTHTIMWTVDSHDWAEELNGNKITKEYLINRVLSNSANKGIVLMHVGGYETVNALPEIITGLKKAGYSLVKVNHMLPTPQHTKDYIYTVVKGDTLYGISKKFGVTVEELIKANNLK